MGAAAATIGANTVGARMPSMSGIVPPTSDTSGCHGVDKSKLPHLPLEAGFFHLFFNVLGSESSRQPWLASII